MYNGDIQLEQLLYCVFDLKGNKEGNTIHAYSAEYSKLSITQMPSMQQYLSQLSNNLTFQMYVTTV